MTEQQVNLILEITDTLKKGLTSNHDFSKQIAQGVKGLADFVIILEQRVRKLEQRVRKLEEDK